MKIKLQWLNELVDLKGIGLTELVEKISLYSVEVEGVRKLVDVEGLVIGHVLTKVQHPNADKLSLLTVDVKEEVLEIICGAANVDVGQYVIVAKAGAVLPGNFKIKKSKIRGIYSNGMVCSLEELGIDHKFVDEVYHDGIYYFNEPQKIGSDAIKVLNLDDVVLDLDITPDRGDLLSMLGIALDLSAIFNRPLKPLAYKTIYDDFSEQIDVKISTDKCLTYYASVIKDVEIKKSPTWIISRLIAFGIRPINNCVDITNYILALFGQPLHAFDYRLLGNKIEVRNAAVNEEIITLDGEKRKLTDNDIVITNGKKPVALGGVMGGFDTEITKDTKDIVLEAAVFDPITIRKTASRLGFRSESSYRYERGVDLNRTKLALDYALYLFKTLANAKVSKEYSFAGIEKIVDKKIKLDVKDVSSILGIKINREEIVKILESLHFTVDENLVVSVPNRRSDINIKEDLIEEIVRIYGYDKLPSTLPKDDMIGKLTTDQKNIRKIKMILSELGLAEIITYSLVGDKENKEFTYFHDQNGEQIKLLMPLSNEHKSLRLGLLPSIVEVCKYNFAHRNFDLAFFEISSVYYSVNKKTKERKFLTGAMVNQFSNTLWNGKEEIVDFYLVKGILEHLFKLLGIKASFIPTETVSGELHPKRTAEILIGKEKLGFLGQLHPQYAKDNDIDEVYVFDLDLDLLLENVNLEVVYEPISKIPFVERDIAVIVKEDVLANSLVESIYASDRALLKDVKIFDLYRGENVGDDEKSIAIKLIFGADKPLVDEDISKSIKKIVNDLEYRFNAKLRS